MTSSKPIGRTIGRHESAVLLQIIDGRYIPDLAGEDRSDLIDVPDKILSGPTRICTPTEHLAKSENAVKIQALFGRTKSWARSNHVLQQAISEGRLIISDTEAI